MALASARDPELVATLFHVERQRVPQDVGRATPPRGHGAVDCRDCSFRFRATLLGTLESGF